MKRFIAFRQYEPNNVIVWFARLYGKIIKQTMLTASGLSTVQTLKPYNNLLIAPACMCTLCIARYLLLKIGIYWTCSIIVLFANQSRLIEGIDGRQCDKYKNVVIFFMLVTSNII